MIAGALPDGAVPFVVQMIEPIGRLRGYPEPALAEASRTLSRLTQNGIFCRGLVAGKPLSPAGVIDREPNRETGATKR